MREKLRRGAEDNSAFGSERLLKLQASYLILKIKRTSWCGMRGESNMSLMAERIEASQTYP